MLPLSSPIWHPNIANTCCSFESRMRLGDWGMFVVVSLAAWGLTVAIASAVAEAGGLTCWGLLW